MNIYAVMILLTVSFGAGFLAAVLCSLATFRRLRKEKENLRQALFMAGETIIEQTNEIHGILVHAHKCEAEFIN